MLEQMLNLQPQLAQEMCLMLKILQASPEEIDSILLKESEYLPGTNVILPVREEVIFQENGWRNDLESNLIDFPSDEIAAARVFFDCITPDGTIGYDMIEIAQDSQIRLELLLKIQTKCKKMGFGGTSRIDQILSQAENPEKCKELYVKKDFKSLKNELKNIQININSGENAQYLKYPDIYIDKDIVEICDNISIFDYDDKIFKLLSSSQRAKIKLLIHSLENRINTLKKIGVYIQKTQLSWLNGGDVKNISIIDASIALKINKSTLYRALHNKVIDTPRGLFKMEKFFKNKHIVQKRSIIQFIKNNLDKSDQAISVLLKDLNVNISRRTVNKYRNLK